MKTTLIAQTGWDRKFVRCIGKTQTTLSQEIVAEIPSYSSDTDNDFEKKKP